DDRATRLGAGDLLLTAIEGGELAALLGVDAGVLDSAGGWPALARLTAVAGQSMAERYLWEEVLEGLGPDTRHVLATLSAIGGADDELASIVLETPVRLETVLEGVPLVAQRSTAAHGRWHVPHDLWQPFVGND